MSNWLKKYWLVILCCFLAIFTPIILNHLFKQWTIQTGPDLKNEHWLGFWGSYLGALIGVIPAYLALNHSHKESKQQHFESLEARRCSLLPIVDLTILPIDTLPTDEMLLEKYYVCITDEKGDESSSSPLVLKRSFNSKLYYNFFVRNIGAGPAMSATITSDENITYFEGDVSTTLDINLILQLTSFTTSHLPKTTTFRIRYYDVFKNLYERKYTIIWHPGPALETGDSTPPELIERATPPSVL